MTMKVSELKIGDALCHSNNEHWYQTGIQIFSRSMFQHCSSVTGENEIHEALSNGYVKRKLSDRLEGRIVVKRPCFVFDPDLFVNVAKSMEGAPYDYKGTFINQMIFNVCDILNTKRPKLKDNAKAWYCSEAALYLYYISTLGRFFDNYELDPGEVESNYILFDTYELEF
jgi:hypothetical protein